MLRSLDPIRERHDKSHPTTSDYEAQGVVGPQVGEPWPQLNPEDVAWPDVNAGAFRFSSTKDGTKSSHSLTVRFQLKTRLCVLVLLGAIAGYAMHENNVELLKIIVRTVGGGRNSSTSESPP